MSTDDHSTTARAWEPTDDDPRQNRCQNWGDVIDHNLGRVFGDNQDRARRCLGCATHRELREGGAAGFEVQPAKSQTVPRSGGQRGESL